MHDGRRPATNSDCDGNLGEGYWSAQSNGHRQMSAKTRRLREDTDYETNTNRYGAWQCGRRGTSRPTTPARNRCSLRVYSRIGEFALVSRASAETSPLTDPEWSKTPGSPFVGYAVNPLNSKQVLSVPPPIHPMHRGQAQLEHRSIGCAGLSPQTVSTSSAVIVVFPT